MGSRGRERAMSGGLESGTISHCVLLGQTVDRSSWSAAVLAARTDAIDRKGGIDVSGDRLVVDWNFGSTSR